jgi:origin recognition complex subunit 4
MWRVLSPLSPDGIGWRELLRRALIPWEYGSDELVKQSKPVVRWKGDWQFAIDVRLFVDHDAQLMYRRCWNTTRLLKHLIDYVASRPMSKSYTGLSSVAPTVHKPHTDYQIAPITEISTGISDFLSVPQTCRAIMSQTENASWGLSTSKLKGLPHPSLGVLIISKHLAYAGRDEFTFAMVEEEYLRFARTKLVGSGRTRWPLSVLKSVSGSSPITGKSG